jgi:hypothetical protein
VACNQGINMATPPHKNQKDQILPCCLSGIGAAAWRSRLPTTAQQEGIMQIKSRLTMLAIVTTTGFACWAV